MADSHGWHIAPHFAFRFQSHFAFVYYLESKAEGVTENIWVVL
jgi:hypothetical protein